MKITDPEVIKNGEKDLIASVQEDLDPGMVREILKDRLATAEVNPKGGRLVVHNNDVAFRLDFQVNLSGSLLFDRNGNLIEEVPAEEKAGAAAPDHHLEDEALEDESLTDDDMEPGMAPGLDDTIDEEPAPDLDDDLDSDLPDELPDDLTAELEAEFLSDDEPPEVAEAEDDAADSGDLDDDISDLLKESREFWAQKKQP